jgi:hypothetical protein
MGIAGSLLSGFGRSVRSRLPIAALATGIVMMMARPSAAGPITGRSWDGTPPGTLADLSGQTDYMFGRSAFSAGVYSVTWLGGVTAWRDFTTIGAGDQVLFNPGRVDNGTTRTITMTDPWTLWGTTPDLDHAESTGQQWAFANVSDDMWLWGMEDIRMGYCDCDYQDAYGMLTRVGDLPSTLGTASLPLGTLSSDVGDTAVAVIPEPATIGLVALVLAGLASRRWTSR